MGGRSTEAADGAATTPVVVTLLGKLAASTTGIGLSAAAGVADGWTECRADTTGVKDGDAATEDGVDRIGA